jgi:hypothetical protein
MPWATVKLEPGTNVEWTPTLIKAGYTRTQLGRFKAGMFQKLGGWQKYFDGSVGGVPRALHAWQDLNNDKRLAIGTTTGLFQIPVGGTIQALTPQTFDSDTPPDFSTTIGSPIVEVVDPNTSGLTTDNSVFFRTPVSVGGIILSGVYPIATITGSDSYTIVATTDATATVANGGVVPVFTTVAGSPSVNVELPDHAQFDGSTAVFDEPTTVGGIVVQGRYTVVDVVDVDNFTVIADAVALANDTQDMNGGDAGFTYYIALGPAPAGVGFGVGFYGLGAYGLGTSSAGVQTGTPITATDWTLDNWGEILFACPENGGIYWWQPNTGFQNARLIGTGPLFNTGMFASMGAQQVFAYGTSIDARLTGGIGIYQDPLLVGWSDVANFLQWEPTVANFARSYRIPTGSAIVAGGATKNRNLLWTDLGVWTFTFNGGASVYTPNQVGTNCGIIGKHAWASNGDTTFWMGRGNFFRYAGAGVVPMPCSVWDSVFDDLNPALQHQVVAGSNTDFTEIWWFYPSLSGGIKYVKYNIVENVWDDTIGELDRTAWIDRSVVGNPIGASSTGLIYYHEMGSDADNVPLTPLMETGRFNLDEGRELVFLDAVYPNFIWGKKGQPETAQIQVTILAYDESDAEPREYGPYTVTKNNPAIVNPSRAMDKTRIRCREVAMRISSQDVGSFWRIGGVRFRYAPDGKR